MVESMNKKKVITIANLAGTNIGDDAVFLGLLNLIKNKVSKNVEIYTLSGIPHVVKERFVINDSVELLKFYEPKNIIKAIKFLKKSDILIFGGGGLISYDLRHNFLLFLARLLGIPIFICGVGAIPISYAHSSISLLSTKLVLNNVDFITVRDKQSKKILRNLGINKTPIIVTADLAFALYPYNSKLTNFFKKNNLKIGINVNKYSILPNKTIDKNKIYDKIFKAIARFSDFMIKKHTMPRSSLFFRRE